MKSVTLHCGMVLMKVRFGFSKCLNFLGHKHTDIARGSLASNSKSCQAKHQSQHSKAQLLASWHPNTYLKQNISCSYNQKTIYLASVLKTSEIVSPAFFNNIRRVSFETQFLSTFKIQNTSYI